MSLTRLEALVGTRNLVRLRTLTVLVCGLGGVGSFAAEALARSGLGRLVLADCDVVDETNKNRQLVALSSTVGQRKTAVMARRVRDIDPAVDVRLFEERIDSTNLDRLLDPRPDYVVDAIDDVPAKVALIARCAALGIKVVSSAGFANKRHPELIRIDALEKTSVDPLARVLRSRLRALRVPLSVPIVWSTESPSVPKTPGIRLGSCATVPSAAGLFLASKVLNDILEEE
ncbi:MAG: tRNA threonylcarbamoyladenosine dehydratase [Candidatus Izemoplasmatales bacterium]